MILSSNVSGKLSWRGALTMAVFVVVALPHWSLAQTNTHHQGKKANEIANREEPSRVETQDEQPTSETADPAELIKSLAERAAYWTSPGSPELKTLEYTYLLGHNPQSITLKAGAGNVRYSNWQGCTLRTGIHTLLREPERFSTTMTKDANGDTVTITATLSPEDTENLGIEVGNGINGSWRGYYSHSTREVVLTVDAKRHVPLVEKCGATTVRYSQWQEVSPNRWVPGTLDVSKGQTQYRMHFEWAGNAVWLLTYAEAISRDGAETIARTKDVKVNDIAAMRERTAREKSQEEDLAILRRMLAKNQAWLNPSTNSFDSLQYTFKTIREDVAEQGYIGRDGTTVMEVVHDGKGEMGDQLGERKIALPTKEVAYTHRDARFAKLSPHRERLKSQPMDQQLRHYARIGCQFNLPLFRYHERLKNAQIKVEEGEWKGKPCHVARISNLGRDVYLGAGTMYGFTSWSYVHHIRPVHELIYIDSQTHLPIHESFVGTEPKRSFEIEFDDYTEVSDGQWAPLSIRVESKDYFTAEYEFQLVQDKHWMLKEVVSWFAPANQSRGVVENLKVNKTSAVFSAAMTQVDASRKLFVKARGDKRQPLTATPIQFGKRTKIGPYSALLTVAGPWSTSIKIETKAATGESVIPVLLLDKQQRPLLAKHVALTADGDMYRGEAAMGFSSKIGEVASIVIPNPTAVASDLRPLATAKCAWDQPIAINSADPDNDTTRAYEAVLTRNDDGTANAKLTVASSNGPAKFMLDLSVAILNNKGKLISVGTNHANMLVKTGIVEESFDIELAPAAKLTDASQMIVAVNVGDTVSAPMGSTCGRFMHDGPWIPLDVLLDADDDACRMYGLQKLNAKIRLDKEFFDDLRDRERLQERGGTRVKLLAPHTKSIARIIQQTSDESSLVEALRLLGHSGDANQAAIVHPQLNHKSDLIADVASIAAAMLGDTSGFDRMRAILGRRVPSWENERDERRAFDRLETDAVIALASVSDAPSIKLLGEILEGDLNSLELATHEKGHKYLTGRQDRIKRVIQALGYCEKAGAAGPLVDAVKFFDENAEISELFDQLPLVEALMQYEANTRELISEQISEGNDAYIRAIKLNAQRNPYYVAAVHEMLFLPDTTAWTAWQGARYLWNVGSPEAVDVLRDAYAKDIHKGDLRTRFTICEALASFNDDRVAVDAFEALTEFYSMTTPPSDKTELKVWEDRREDLKEGAEGIFGRVSQKAIDDLVHAKLRAVDSPQRRAVIETIWHLPKIPDSVLPALREWRENSNAPMLDELTKLLSRE